MKKIYKEITAVLAIAILIALLYNLFTPKPLPWIAEKKVVEVVNDSLLFGTATDTTAFAQTDTINVAKIQDSVSKVIKDTISLITEKKADASVIKEGESAGLKTLTFSQVMKAIKNPKFQFVDARPTHDWEASHIGNALNIYPYDENHEAYFKLLTSLPKDKTIIVYCSGGNCEASHKVVNDLLSFGYSNVFLYSGGWDDWTKQGGK